MLTLDTIYFVSQTLMVFIPDSASERVLKDTGPTCVTVVVVVALCTIPAHHRHAADDGGICHSARLLHTQSRRAWRGFMFQ